MQGLRAACVEAGRVGQPDQAADGAGFPHRALLDERSPSLRPPRPRQELPGRFAIRRGEAHRHDPQLRLVGQPRRGTRGLRDLAQERRRDEQRHLQHRARRLRRVPGFAGGGGLDGGDQERRLRRRGVVQHPDQGPPPGRQLQEGPLADGGDARRGLAAEPGDVQRARQRPRGAGLVGRAPRRDLEYRAGDEGGGREAQPGHLLDFAEELERLVEGGRDR
mmetsp:Transcript_71290/g.199946  ORF Transcript_71290/g.199946 Transcript_71290/m.199946 type:complete len:220 (+) Transcript_71290:491-1150(+)